VTDAQLLFDDGAERVVIEAWQVGAILTVQNRRGLEFLVVAGNLSISGTTLAAQGWGRLPAGQALTATAGPKGVTVWVKDAPLQHADILTIPA
jgi:hypothetical protein